MKHSQAKQIMWDLVDALIEDFRDSEIYNEYSQEERKCATSQASMAMSAICSLVKLEQPESFSTKLTWATASSRKSQKAYSSAQASTRDMICSKRSVLLLMSLIYRIGGPTGALVDG